MRNARFRPVLALLTVILASWATRFPHAAAELGPELEKIATKAGDISLRLIPAGTFQMGSADDDKDALDNEKPRREVRITRPFYLGITEITQGQYKAVTGQNPSYFSASGQGTLPLPPDRPIGVPSSRCPGLTPWPFATS